jgi:hypothetical protein
LVRSKLTLASAYAGPHVSESIAALAELPICVFITTRFDARLADALRAAGKNPLEAHWEPRGAPGPDAEPTRDRPLLYQLHGSLSNASAVITTSDQFRFMGACSASPDSVPLRIRALLARGSPVFLDFEPGSPELRVVGAQFQNIRALASRATGYLVPAGEPNSRHPDKELLKADAFRMGLRPYGGPAEEFVGRLLAEWRSISHA